MVYLQKKYLTNETQVVVGASYKVTDDLDKLVKVWMESSLGHLERKDLRGYLNKVVKAAETRSTQAEAGRKAVVMLEPGTVKCRSAKGDVHYFPVKCLSRVDTITGESVDPEGNKLKETAGANKPEYFVDIRDIKEGEYYRITSNLDRLKKEWTKCQLEIMNVSKLRSLLRKFVKIEKVEPDFNACLVSGDHENDLTYIPFNCLLDPSYKKNRAGSKKPPKPADGAQPSGYVSFVDCVRGRRYKVTSDIEHLRQHWELAGLDSFVELEYFLKVDGRCTDLDLSDETVKLTWKTGSEEEWFPAKVLTISYSKDNASTSKSKSEESSKNKMNVHEEAANIGAQRNIDHLDQVYKNAGINYLKDAKHAAMGREYQITNDIARMERFWRESGFDDVEREFLRRYLDRRVRIVQVEIADQSCQVRLEDTMDNIWVPAQVLIILSSVQEKPDRRRPEHSAVLLRVGDNVRLVRVARSDYENCRGRLVQYLTGKQKWRVHLEYWDKIVLVRSSNIEKERTDSGIQDLSEIQLGAYYRVTTDYQLLAHSLESMGEKIDNEQIEPLVELLGEVVYTKSVDPQSGSVECMFNNNTSKNIPFYILSQVGGERERPQEDGAEDLRDMIGYL